MCINYLLTLKMIFKELHCCNVLHFAILAIFVTPVGQCNPRGSATQFPHGEGYLQAPLNG